MITTLFLSILNAFVGFLLALLPTGSLPNALLTAIQSLWYVLNTFTYIFPVTTLLLAVGVVLAFDIAVLIWHLIQWIIRKIPGMQ